jgi:hypothetical protein
MQMDMFGDEKAFLAKQRMAWAKAIEGDGAICPCCDRKGKINRGKLSQHLALALKWIEVHGDPEDDGFVDCQGSNQVHLLRSKTYSQMKHWDLVEPKAGRSGFWRVTSKGKEFLLGKITVPQAVYVYNDKVFGFDDKEISFRQCFGRHFNFDEMMSSQFRWENIKGDENE